MLELIAESLLVAMGQKPFRKTGPRLEDRPVIADGGRHRWIQRDGSHRQD